MTVVDMIALHHRIQREQDFDASRFQIGLHFLPAAIVDVIVGHQASWDHGSLNATRTAIGYMIAPDQMAARLLLQHLLISTFRPLIGECTDFDSHGIDLANRVIFDDPVVPTPCRYRSISRTNEPIARMLKSQPLDPDIPQPLYLWIEQILSGGGLHNHLIGISPAERVQMQFMVGNVDPERSSDPG